MARAYEPDTLVVGPFNGGTRVTPATADTRALSYVCDVTLERSEAYETRDDELVYRFRVLGQELAAVRLKSKEIVQTCRQLSLVGRGTDRVMQFYVDDGQLLVWFRKDQCDQGYPKNYLLRRFVAAIFRAI